MAKYVKTEQGYIETADFLDRKMDKNNPTGTGSFSLNRKAGTVVGNFSHTEGYNTTASDHSSHAEGTDATASGTCSHAEGNDTTASGNYSHAEGDGTTASGNYSHAEGSWTTASGNFSHVEGNGTEASSACQHVQGKLNIEDSSGVYADIIGNGTSTTKRSNAATVDWHGNAWYAGDVYVGSTSGTNKDEGSKKLATEEYVDNSTASIEIPTTLPNPQSLTFTGAAEGTYDGSSEVSVEIPDISGKMDKNNPTGTGSFSLNRKAGTTIGLRSHAEGYNTEASAEGSHAEGGVTKALGYWSHAEGNATTASGTDSHAEGYYNRALGNESHAEGNVTEASGIGSHAEGGVTKALGHYSHAEGVGTVTSGANSHAEGSDTKASSACQHVQGKFNIEDSSDVYADIIGNGTSDDDRSNAATVDWSGNAWYAGDVYVGSTSGTNKDEGSKKLATEEYVDNSTASIDIPTTLPNPQSLTFTGAVEGTYDGSSALAVEIPSTPEIPTQLPNPNAITFTGAVTGTYDGSAPLSVNIPSALADLTTDSAHRLVTDTEKSTWNAKAEVSAIPTKVSQLTNDSGYLTSAPVTSVNGKTGAVTLTIPSKTSDITNDSDFATNSDVTTGISTHNSSTEAHNDIRLLVQELMNKLNALADSDDTTLDQLSEIVSYIKNNKSLIDGITTSKVSVTDIIDNLTTSVTNKPLSAKQGVALKALIDAIVVPTKLPNPNAITFTGAVEGTYDGSSALAVEIPSTPEIPTQLPNPKSLTFTGAVTSSYDGSNEVSVEIPGALSDLSEDATHRVVTDAEKAKWNAKSNFSGSYNDLTDKPTVPDAPVQSVNGKTGAVVLSAEDVGALPGSTVIPTALPNPNAITFTGAVTSSYDGSAPLSVKIPTVDDVLAALPAWEGGSY